MWGLGFERVREGEGREGMTFTLNFRAQGFIKTKASKPQPSQLSANKLYKINERKTTTAKSPQQGDLRLSDPPSGQIADDRARTRDRRVPADLRADSLSTMPPTPPY
ncbi:hypothetical protein PoB_007202100 [Plakobranchus ocellatus]|uniref:Uncharacterized protein n=1 Tax=Plakobranchus ocellatus TaxID=259542 RepID=A0AAV4DN00_9GAST|nr:hypothetical protein PoB_007202100 [Plakobranchus ocellatus]